MSHIPEIVPETENITGDTTVEDDIDNTLVTSDDDHSDSGQNELEAMNALDDSTEGDTEEERHRLGHEKLLNKLDAVSEGDNEEKHASIPEIYQSGSFDLNKASIEDQDVDVSQEMDDHFVSEIVTDFEDCSLKKQVTGDDESKDDEEEVNTNDISCSNHSDAAGSSHDEREPDETIHEILEVVIDEVEPDEGPFSPSNPFCDDDENEDQTKSKNLIPSMNPFGDDEDDSGSEVKQEGNNLIRKPSKPFNPFDDGEIEAVGSVDHEEVLHRRKAVTESLAPFTLASMLSKGRDRSPSLTQSDVPAKTYCKEYLELMTLGFDKVCVGNALQKTSGDVVIARKMLMSRLFDDHILTSDELYVWKSPVMVRVGSWLPNVRDDSGSIHTSFFINVTMTLGNESWRVGHRYSEFYTFYSAVYNQLCKSFSGGMKNLFPSDRLSNWLSLSNQETINDNRRLCLDSWLRELCNSPQMLLHDPSRKIIFKFLQVDENMAKVKRVPPAKFMSTQSESKTDRKVTHPKTAGPTRDDVSASPTSAPTPLSSSMCCKDLKLPGAGNDVPTAPLILSPENIAFRNRKKAALAAQKNDYYTPPSDGVETALKSSEPSSSGFKDVRSKSFAKRLNPSNP